MSKEQMVIPAIVTPIRDKQISQTEFTAFLAWLKESGIEQVVAFGSTGEGIGAFPEDAKLVNDLVQESGLKCILGIANPNPVQVNKIIKHVKPEAIMLPPPFTTKASQSDIALFYQSINPEVPLLLYNNFARFGLNITFETYKKIFNSCNVWGVKECADKEDVLWQQLRGTDVTLLAGDDVNWLDLDVDGCVSVLANCFPKLTIALSKGLQGNIKEDLCSDTLPVTADTWKKLCPVLATASTPLQVKYLLNKLGLMSMETMLAYQPITEEQQTTIHHILAC